MNDPDWKTRYASKLMSRERALAPISPGATIFLGSGSAEPRHLAEGVEDLAGRLLDSEILQFIALGIVPSDRDRAAPGARRNAFFVGGSSRRAVAEGRADYTPVYTSELPGLFHRHRPRVDVALVQVTPPDRHGYVSLGVSVDVTKAAVEAAKYVVAEVNPHLPRTFGDSFVKVSRIDALVEHASALIEYPEAELDEVAGRIGGHISDLVRDGATIQIGMGAIPNAVASSLKDKRDLGVHSEMVSDWLVDLVESGAVTNGAKTLHPGKVIAALAIGSKRLYDFVDDNPGVEFHPSSYTNDPQVIGQNDFMVTINTGFQVDLTGQVCSDTLDRGFYGGIVGQVDFARGAMRSRGGKPIIALASTAKGGTVSKIVPRLEAGAGVVTTRGSVRYVVTEWGCADLQGRTIRERAMALISIAHPKFREDLLRAARELRFVYPDQVIPSALDLYPGQYEHCVSFDGTSVLFRPVKITDEPL
ncbi:MAG TPA: acetyl-CoA hydrolase/transferase C-terminal domain-containing protein, partial [Deferrisomatales bacterium]|nr:acetyl-CoA hydrolase/transferase C-terminal domain-containing protein [Deferrisomatales bacterium]